MKYVSTLYRQIYSCTKFLLVGVLLFFIYTPLHAITVVVGPFNAVTCPAGTGQTLANAYTTIQAQNDGGGHTIQICPGTHTAQNLRLSDGTNGDFDNLIIEGTTGIAADVTVNPSGNGETFDIQAVAVTIRHLTVDNGSNNNDGIELRSNNAVVSNVGVLNTGRNGILLSGSTNVTLSNVVIDTTVREGILANGASTGVTIDSADGTKPSTSVNNTTRECIEIDSANADLDDIDVSNCNNIGIRLDGANPSLDNITVDTTSSDGIYINGLAPLLNQTDTINNTISITNAGRDGIRTTNAADNFLMDNITINGTTQSCAELQGNGDGVAVNVENFTLSNCGVEGLWLRSPDQVVNDVTINTTGTGECIELDGNDIIIDNNGGTLSNCGTDGLQIDGQRADIDNLVINITSQHGVDVNNNDANLNNVTITNIGPGGSGFDGINTNRGRVTLTNISVDTVDDFGIHVNDSNNNRNNVTLSDISVTNSGDDGIMINRITATLNVDNVSVTNSAARGMELSRTTNGNFTNLFLDNNTGDGLALITSSSNDISLSEFSNNGNRGILINGNATNGPSINNDIHDNLLEDNASRGLRIQNTDDNINNTIYDNCFSNPGASQNLQNQETGGTNNFDNGSRGNFWGPDTPNPTGFSESCADSDANEICDSPFVIPGAGGGQDNFPRTLCEIGTVGKYYFDQGGWTGAAGEVLDSSDNLLHATAIPAGANVPLNPGADGPIPGTPGTCFYGSFDQVDDYIELPGGFPDLDGSFTITAWIQSDDISSGGQRVFADDENNTQGFAVSLSDGTNGTIRFFSRGVTPVIVDTQSPVISAGQWHHVAVVHNVRDKSRQIYIDGTAVTLSTGGTSSTYTGTWGTDAGTASIGGETAASAEAALKFDGLIDEVRFYQFPLRGTDIQRIMNTSRPCSGFSHYSISYPDGNTGITCEDSTVRITGHDFSDAIIAVPQNTVLNLSTDSVNAMWLPAGGPGLPDVGSGTWTSAGTTAVYTWPGPAEEASFEVRLQDGTAETVNINLLDDAGRTELKSNTAEDPSITFQTQGFRITRDGMTAAEINTHISGKDTDVGFGADTTLTIQAVLDTGGATCGNFGGPFNNVNVTVASECLDPAICEVVNGGPGTQVMIEDNGMAFVPMGVNDSGLPNNNSTNVLLNFDAQTRAQLNINYADAGLLQLHFFVPAVGGIFGTSNAFVVRPFGFSVRNLQNSSGGSNPAATDENGGVFTVAGDSLTADIAAVVWEQVDDDGSTGGVADDGIPDSNSALSSNIVTPNFGNESSAVIASLSHTLVEPSTGSPQPGILTGSGNFSGFTSGVVSGKSMSFNEVGIIQLDLNESNNNYLGGGQDIIGQIAHVGRFTPANLTVAVQGSTSFADSCSGFTYQDQTFYYSNPAPRIRIRGVDTSGNVTFNYDSTAFWKLNTDLGMRTYTDLSGAAANFEPPVIDNGISVLNLGNYNGRVDLRLDNGTNGDAFMYSRVSEEAPFNASVQLTFDGEDLTDDDGICYDGDGDGNCEGAINNDDDFVYGAIGNTELRFGRLSIGKAVGPEEVIPLNVPFVTESHDGTGFVTNLADSCTTISDLDVNTVPDLVLSNSFETAVVDGDIQICGAGGTSTLTLANNPLVAGDGLLSFSPPGTACTGFSDISLDLSSMLLEHLLYDWDGIDQGGDTDLFDDNPTGRATFGIISRPKEVIYSREPW